MADLKNVIESSFVQYAGAVLQSRALVDVRDCLKPSARQIFYCLYTDKFTYDKPFKKTLKGIGSASRLHIHGDSSCLGIIMRAGQPFAMRYPLIDVEGSYGTLLSSGSWAAPRYTASRLSEISEFLFGGIKKNTIEEWRDNYDNTEKYPAVLPSIGFYNIVNGTMGIGIGASSSIPPTNLREVNSAIIKLIQDENVPDKEILCLPDFPTGGILLNKDEVAEALLKGQGKSCRIRSVINYDEKDNCLVVVELPYALYTNTICGELESILENENNKLIERFNDLTGKEPLIKIYLKKGANPKKALDFLYKNTSLESYFSINLTMLDNGRFPRVFGWKEALQNYITHIRTCKRRELQFDYDKMLARENILEGLILASANIDEVVSIIRASESPEEASKKLIARFKFNEEQTKAILAMKLSTLTKIDSIKLQNELNENKKQLECLEEILNSPEKLDAELIKILKEVADKFGDARRTKILDNYEEEEEVVNVEEKNITVMVLSNNTLVYTEQELEGAKKGRKGKTLPIPKNVKVIDSFYTTNLSTVYILTQSGKMYSHSLARLEENEALSFYDLGINANDNVVKVFPATNLEFSKYLFFITKQGMLKKTISTEYQNVRKGTQAIKLKSEDEIVDCFFVFDEKEEIMTFSSAGNVVRFKQSEVAPTGRATAGVKGMRLGNDEEIISGFVLSAEKEYKGVFTVSTAGQGKITPLNEFSVTSRTARGIVCQKLDGEKLNVAYLIGDEEKLTLLAGNKIISLETKDIPIQGRTTIGVKLINLGEEKQKIRVLCS